MKHLANASRFEIELVATRVKSQITKWATSLDAQRSYEQTLIELRMMWKRALPAHKIGYHAEAYDDRGFTVDDGWGMGMYGDYASQEAAMEGAKRMLKRGGKKVARVVVRYSIQRVEGQSWVAGSTICTIQNA